MAKEVRARDEDGNEQKGENKLEKERDREQNKWRGGEREEKNESRDVKRRDQVLVVIAVVLMCWW